LHGIRAIFSGRERERERESEREREEKIETASKLFTSDLVIIIIF